MLLILVLYYNIELMNCNVPLRMKIFNLISTLENSYMPYINCKRNEKFEKHSQLPWNRSRSEYPKKVDPVLRLSSLI